MVAGPSALKAGRQSRIRCAEGHRGRKHSQGPFQARYGSGGGSVQVSRGPGADPTCAHRERHPRFRTLTQRSVLTDAQTDWAAKRARKGAGISLESTLVPFVWPRTAVGSDQGPPSVEPRWRRCSVQIQIWSNPTSGCRSEPYLPAMCTPISAWAPISCDDEDLQNWRCRTAGPRGMNEPEDKRQQPQIITSPNSRDDPLRIQPARCYHAAQTRPGPKAIQTRIEKSRELPPGETGLTQSIGRVVRGLPIVERCGSVVPGPHRAP